MLEKLSQKGSEILFGKTPRADRQVYLDYLRVIATVFVIGVHTVSLASSMLPQESMSFHILEIFDFIFLSSNLLFVMISGALLLPIKEERAGTFFRKRFGKVAVPLVVYYILYVVAKDGVVWLTPRYWRVLFQRIVKGPPDSAPHFWLIYTILALYVLTPFLRWILQNISEEVLAGVIVVVFLVNALDNYAPVFGLDAHLSVIVDSFVGVYLLGYFLTRVNSPVTERIFLVGGAVSFLLSVGMIFLVDNYFDYIYQNAPTMMLFTSGIFLFVKKRSLTMPQNLSEAEAGLAKTGALLCRMICKYSFSIMLIHWGVLHVAVKQLLHVDVLSGGIIGGCLLAILLTLVISLAGAVIIDNTLVWLIHAVFHLIGKCGRRLLGK